MAHSGLEDSEGKITPLDQKLLEDLKNLIIMGPDCIDRVNTLLDQLDGEDKTGLLKKHEDGQSLLQLAAIFHGDVELIKKLGKLCPDLLTEERKEPAYQGQNILHILISKHNIDGVGAILGHSELKQRGKTRLLYGKAVGSIFHGTVMMGELPLSVAALTLKTEMVDKLLDARVKIHAVNTKGDTVLHSLLRYASLYKNEKEVAAMMMHIHKKLMARNSNDKMPPFQSVWQIENASGLTVLKLAAVLELPLLFKKILQLEGLYSQLDRHDGIIDSLLYDVTEIDPVARQKWLKEKEPASEPSRGKVLPFMTEDDFDASKLDVGEETCPHERTLCCTMPTRREKKVPKKKAMSILEIICQRGRTEMAFPVLSIPLVWNIVQEKWVHYRKWYGWWLFYHVTLMSFLMAYAIIKARVVKEAREADAEYTDDRSNITTSQTEKDFVTGMSVAAPLAGLPLLLLEGYRWYQEIRFHKWLLHHNAFYRVLLIIFVLALFVDFIWYWISGANSTSIPLTVALLVGFWFFTFFLRPWHRFAFFTLMIKDVVMGDMLRFSALIGINLFGFSVAMHIIYIATPGPSQDEFKTMPMTLLTLFKLMLGLGEVNVLGEDTYPWVSITLFILFVLLTYLLMINALIAMMSNTCSLVAKNRCSCWKLERMSVVLLLESSLPFEKLLYNSGQPDSMFIYNIQKRCQEMETRYFMKISVLRPSNTLSDAAISTQGPCTQTPISDNPPASSENVLLKTLVYQHKLLTGLFKGKDKKDRPGTHIKQMEPIKEGDTIGHSPKRSETPPPDVQRISKAASTAPPRSM